MKRILLTLALVAAAGTAGAQTVKAPVAGGVNTNVTTPGTSAGANANTQMNTNAGTSGNPAMGSGAQMNGNAQMNSGQMNSGAQTNSGASMNGSANADMANAPTRMTGAAGTAQKRIELDGYKNVQGLAKGSDGLWHGTAMRGSAQVQVTVDRAGNVSAQ